MKSKKITIQKDTSKNIFDELSGEWWNETGNFEALHAFNPLRIKFILNSVKMMLFIKRKKIHFLSIQKEI